MDGSDDVRPESGRRAPDPSVEEMLRRARDAQLGDTSEPTTGWPRAPRFTSMLEAAGIARRRGRLLLLTGLLLVVLCTLVVVHVGDVVGSVLAPLPSSGQTAPALATNTPVPTPTDTLSPTPTDVPTAPTSAGLLPPSAEEIVFLARDFYDRWPPLVGTHMQVDAAIVQVQSQDDTHIAACIAFSFATVSAPDTPAGQDTRLFMLVPGSDGTWQVTGMYYSGSCRPN